LVGGFVNWFKLHPARENELNRFVLIVVVLLVSAAQSMAFPFARHRTYVKTPQHPDAAIIEALIWLYRSSSKAEQLAYQQTGAVPPWWCKFRFFHFLSVSDEDLYDEVQNFRAYLPMVNGTGPTVPIPIVIDKAGRVLAVDITGPGWSAQAFHEVAKLDVTCREPHLNHQLADELRRALGLPVDIATFHCEGLVPGPWFVREIQETDRHRNDPENIAYYNLLYSRERFGDDIGHEPVKPKERPWKGGVFPGDGKDYKPGAFDYVPIAEMTKYEADLAAWKAKKRVGFIARDFPRDANDFRERWGSKASNDFLGKQRAFKSYGAVIAGAFNDPKNGSFVSDNDRVNRFLNTTYGLAMETNDFELTAGKKNIANFPLEVALDELDEDASEKISQKQDDYPAWFLNGPKRLGSKRVESGDPHVVHDKTNGGTVIVQTMNKCVGCHYPSDVVLAPSNSKVVEAIKRRNQLLAYSEVDRQILDGFFNGGSAAKGGWERKLKSWREPFAFSLSVATTTTIDKDGWTGAKFAKTSNGRRDMYDYPVTLDQAAAELGFSRLVVVVACTIEGSIDAGNLLLDSEPGVPRAAWDADLFLRLANIISLAREAENPDPVFAFFFPELIRAAKEEVFRVHKYGAGK